MNGSEANNLVYLWLPQATFWQHSGRNTGVVRSVIHPQAQTFQNNEVLMMGIYHINCHQSTAQKSKL